jgi:hypothetical protein
MFRLRAAPEIAAIFCLLGASCQALTGDVEVIPAAPGPAPSASPTTSEGPAPSPDDGVPSGPVGGVAEVPGAGAPLDNGLPPAGDGTGASPNAEEPGPPDVDTEADAGPPPPAPRPVLVQGGAAELERVGEEGGEPHLGVCEGGVVIGIRHTANPSEDVFGQRVTLVEPLCGTLVLEPGSAREPDSRVRVVADERILAWPVTDELAGPPVTEIPDPRLVWVAQPPTLCPESAPVLVGLSGEYDPSAPDSTNTAAIRSVVIECAPLVVEPDGIGVSASELGRQLIARGDSFAAEGAADYGSSCPDGTVITQILVHAGFWLDGFVLGCSSLTSPHLPGEPCSDGAECQSGVCGDAVCEP